MPFVSCKSEKSDSRKQSTLLCHAETAEIRIAMDDMTTFVLATKGALGVSQAAACTQLDTLSKKVDVGIAIMKKLEIERDFLREDHTSMSRSMFRQDRHIGALKKTIGCLRSKLSPAPVPASSSYLKVSSIRPGDGDGCTTRPLFSCTGNASAQGGSSSSPTGNDFSPMGRVSPKRDVPLTLQSPGSESLRKIGIDGSCRLRSPFKKKLRFAWGGSSRDCADDDDDDDVSDELLLNLPLPDSRKRKGTSVPSGNISATATGVLGEGAKTLTTDLLLLSTHVNHGTIVADGAVATPWEYDGCESEVYSCEPLPNPSNDKAETHDHDIPAVYSPETLPNPSNDKAETQDHDIPTVYSPETLPKPSNDKAETRDHDKGAGPVMLLKKVGAKQVARYVRVKQEHSVCDDIELDP